MARACTVCIHPDRDKIESMVVQGVSNRKIGLQYGLDESVIRRHINVHLPKRIQDVIDTEIEATEGLDVIAQLQEINRITFAIIKESRADKKNGMALFAIDRVQKQLELQAKILGDIDQPSQINIYMSSEWQLIRDTIVQALAPYTDARIAVAAALARVESGGDLARLN